MKLSICTELELGVTPSFLFLFLLNRDLYLKYVVKYTTVVTL